MHQRRYAVGAELVADGRISVQVWAPGRDRVAVVVDGVATVLEPDGDGYSAATVAGHAGSRYGFRLDDDPKTYPDPASRFQPEGPHGLSEVIEPSSYAWRDDRWPGISMKGQVLYEMHVGTFSPAGTWAGAAEQLDRLAALGITAIQMMPVAEFAGSFGWGYDGVGWLAPTRLYGRPDDLRAFVDAAHARGLAVVLDAVYNHLGPDGNYLLSYTRRYVSDRYANEWGDALNFDGEDAAPVRELVLASVEHWIREYHFDGFRLDATQQIFDSSAEHLLTALVRRARAAAGTRQVVIIAENETQHAQLLRPVDQGGSDLDALSNDDFHHTARGGADRRQGGLLHVTLGGTVSGVALRGEARVPVPGSTLQLAERAPRDAGARPTAAASSCTSSRTTIRSQTRPPDAGCASCARPASCAPLTALLLLSPATPLLFQGQELGSTSPFVYFAHHEGELASERPEGPARVPGPVRPISDAGGRHPSARSHRAIDVRDVQASNGVHRTCPTVLEPAPRSLAAEARRPDDSAAGRGRSGWRDSRRAGPRPALFRRAERRSAPHREHGSRPRSRDLRRTARRSTRRGPVGGRLVE